MSANLPPENPDQAEAGAPPPDAKTETEPIAAPGRETASASHYARGGRRARRGRPAGGGPDPQARRRAVAAQPAPGRAPGRRARSSWAATRSAPTWPPRPERRPTEETRFGPFWDVYSLIQSDFAGSPKPSQDELVAGRHQGHAREPQRPVVVLPGAGRLRELAAERRRAGRRESASRSSSSRSTPRARRTAQTIGNGCELAVVQPIPGFPGRRRPASWPATSSSRSTAVARRQDDRPGHQR